MTSSSSKSASLAMKSNLFPVSSTPMKSRCSTEVENQTQSLYNPVLMQAGKTNGTTDHPQSMKYWVSDKSSKSMNLQNLSTIFINFFSVRVADIYLDIQNTGPASFLPPFYEDANYRSWHATLHLELCFPSLSLHLKNKKPKLLPEFTQQTQSKQRVLKNPAASSSS